MATVEQIIDRAQRQLLSGVVEERNKLASLISSTATSIPLSYELSGARAGGMIEIDAEQMYIWEANDGTKTLTVERGFNGTTATSHTANSVVTVNPRFPRAHIIEAVNDELADLSSPANGLFRVTNIDYRYNGSDRQFPIPVTTEIIDLIEVRWRYNSDDYRIVNGVKLLRNLPTKDFNSGVGLQIDADISNCDLRIVCKVPFTKATSESDNLQMNCGFPVSAEDILVVGAQIRLMASREIKRNFTESQGDTRRSDEVPAGAVSNSITNLLRLRRDRITAEAARLNRQYPVFLNRL